MGQHATLSKWGRHTVPEHRKVSSVGPPGEDSYWKQGSRQRLQLVRCGAGRWEPAEQRPGGQTVSFAARASQLAIGVAGTVTDSPELAPKIGPGIQNVLCRAFAVPGRVPKSLGFRRNSLTDFC